jgi:hypothetical protein
MRWLIPIAGTILAAFDKLTAWWGILIIELLALYHFMDGLTGVDREARTIRDEPNVYELLRFFMVTLPMIAGLLVGNAIAHALGAAIGSVALGLIGTAFWARLVARTEREIEARDA